VDATGYSLPDHVISNIGTLLETVETMLSPNVQIIYDQNLLSQIGDAIYKTEITPIIYNKSNKPTFGTLIAQVQTFGYMLDLTKLIYTKRFDSEHKFFVVSARSKDEFATASKAVKCIRALNESANFDIKSQFKLRVLLEASEFGDPEKLRYLLNCLAIAICKVPIIEINPESGHCEYSREFIEISNKISNQVNTILNECEYFSNKSLTA
jgi:hypothetical protein